MYTYKIYKIEKGYGYNILQDNTVIISQPYYPGKEGNTPMTEEEATSLAEDFCLNNNI